MKDVYYTYWFLKIPKCFFFFLNSFFHNVLIDILLYTKWIYSVLNKSTSRIVLKF
jgi:hypothetical protein